MKVNSVAKWRAKLTTSRPKIVAEIKREVRQRCGFGCVLCGRPIYEYDHLLGWANVKRHEASEITLLCDNHHREKTAGFLSNEQIIAADKRPFNVRNGVTSPHTLYYSGSAYSLAIGSLQFEGTMQSRDFTCEVIKIDGESLLGVRLEDDHFLLDMNIYNSRDNLALCISENELILNTQLWDIEIAGSRIIIRESKGNILFDVLFKPPCSLVIRRGRFLRNDIEFLVTPKWCALLNNRSMFRNSKFMNISGIDIGDGDGVGMTAFKIDGFPRHGWDREAALTWAMRQLNL